MACSAGEDMRSVENGFWAAWGASAVAPGLRPGPSGGLETPSVQALRPGGPEPMRRRFQLRHRDCRLLTFSLSADEGGWRCRLDDVNDAVAYLCPMGMALSAAGVLDWLTQRVETSDLARTLLATRALTLRDCYWVSAEGREDSWSDVNLFAHGDCLSDERPDGRPVSRILERSGGRVYLLSAVSPLRDVWLYRAARDAGLSAVPCQLTMRRGRLFSRRLLLTDETTAYVPLSQCFPGKTPGAAGALLLRMGDAYYREFARRLLFDALHGRSCLSGMGLLLDSRLNKPRAFAPCGIGV